MMTIMGNALLGGHGTAFMLMEALTVFLALIGTTLSCINTGARVTYAMGRDEEVPEHFGMLHGKNLTPHRAIWVLATISAVLGAYAALFYFAGGSAPDDQTIATLPHNIWYSMGMSSNASLSGLPNGLLLVTLTSNFGTFLLYGLTNIVCIVAYSERDRKSTRLNSSHTVISYAVFCLKKKKTKCIDNKFNHCFDPVDDKCFRGR